jgi:HAD superfamily hydrolase (TIGR01509 family)
MVKFVFDLDLTLYSDKECTESNNERIYYNSFKEKKQLKQLLDNVKYNKYILTNATYPHAEEVLKRLGVFELFNGILSTDMIDNKMKPEPSVYKTASKLFRIKPNENVYFFEDQTINLKTAKDKFKWNTILICPNTSKKEKHVDYLFKNIEDALTFFTVKEKFNKYK